MVKESERSEEKKTRAEEQREELKRKGREKEKKVIGVRIWMKEERRRGRE